MSARHNYFWDLDVSSLIDLYEQELDERKEEKREKNDKQSENLLILSGGCIAG